MGPCWWCNAPATHYCSGCGHYICSSAACIAKSVAATLGFPVAKVTK